MRSAVKRVSQKRTKVSSREKFGVGRRFSEVLQPAH